jgi:hypothetical protein
MWMSVRTLNVYQLLKFIHDLDTCEGVVLPKESSYMEWNSGNVSER